MATPLGDVVTVEILGQRYPIRSSLDVNYVTELANYVDRKMQLAAEGTEGLDSVRVAVLAALNIADEYFRSKRTTGETSGEDNRLVVELEQIVEAALKRSSSD